jgi:hypothetical protein
MSQNDHKRAAQGLIFHKTINIRVYQVTGTDDVSQPSRKPIGYLYYEPQK